MGRSVRIGLAILAMGIGVTFTGCSGHGPKTAVRAATEITTAAAYPAATFIVLSDLHYYDTHLGTTGQAFQDYMNSDRKMLVESGELLDTAIEAIDRMPADFVLISGDLTKDGETVDHRQVAQRLQRLADSGKKVYVVPGNHDIENGGAVSYRGEDTAPVATVSASEFARIYRRFGYADAIERAPDSLSYVAEPVDGLWLLALDSCRYDPEHRGKHQITAGAYREKTREWIGRMLDRAAAAGKAVIVMQHHGILEHYPGNAKFYGEYLVDDHDTFADRMARAGVSLVFTGHFHAQDITAKSFGDTGRTLYDIETGSLVTAPCPYRIVTISADQRATITSRFIRAIPSHPVDFRSFADAHVYDGTVILADTTLRGYHVPADDRDRLTSQISRAYVTHLKGDEKKPEVVVDKTGVGFMGRLVLFLKEDLLNGWYTDLPPADNEITINLNTGEVIGG